MNQFKANEDPAAPVFLAGGGEVGVCMRQHDWAQSPLGAPSGWPSSLRTVTSLTLNSKTPIFFAWGPELCFLYNDAYLEVLGEKHPAALGRPFREVWSEVWKDVAPLVKQTLAGEALYHENMPFTIVRKGYKEQTWFSFSYSPLRDEQGAVAGLFCSLSETTAQVLAERERVAETERLRRLFEQAPSMMAVVRGPEHVYELANAAYLQLIGRSDVTGKRVVEVIPEVEAQGFIALLDQVYATGQPYIGKGAPVRLRRQPQDEEVEYFIDFIYQPILDASGNITGIFGLGIDVTETVRTTSALQASEERARLATDAAELAIWVWDPVTDEAVWENDRLYQIFGLPKSHGVVNGAQFMSEFLLPEDAAAFEQEVKAALDSGRQFYFQGRFYRKSDRELRWIELKGRMHAEGHSVSSKILGTAADITERKRDEEQARRAAGEALAAAEANAKFRTFFEQGSYFAGVMMLDGTVVEANHLCLDACGFRRDDVIGRKFWECGWWNRSQALMDAVREGSMQAAQGRQFRRELNYFIADGSQRVVDLILSPVTDESGRVLFIAPTGADITERKQTEERLRLLDDMSLATRAAVDPKAVMGSLARLLGEHLRTTRCAYADVEPDNDCFTIRDDWNAVGAASTAGEYSLDLFGPRAAADMRQGRTLLIRDVDRELAASGGADMFNAIGIKAIICCPLVKEGRLVAMMAVHQNAPRNWTDSEVVLVEEVVERSWVHIERVRATEVLRKSEAHLLSLFEQTAAGIAESDLSGRLTRVNDRYCRILGRSRQDLLGRRMQEFTHPDDLNRSLALLDGALRCGQSVEIEKRDVRPDGAEVWVSTTLNVIRPASDTLPRTLLAIVLDITERKRAEERLKEADRRKDEFLAMLAHELRNPLAPIGAAADLLQLAPLNEERIRQTSEIISRQVRHMTGLVDDLLDVSRVTRGLVKLDHVVLDAGRVIADAVEQVRPLIESRRHHLTLELAAAPALVAGDHKRLVQILTNLLNNAAKYTPEGGNIHLQMLVGGGQIQLSVLDDGIGIAPQLQARVFDLFTQAERTADRSQGGLGIGLALVKSLAELHGGTAGCFSEGIGKGSRFTVTLPQLLEQENVLQKLHGVHMLPQAARKLRILIVDDNIDAAQMPAMYLETLGHEVITEHGSKRALERAGIEMPDACVLDIGLPEIDGNALARMLRKQSKTAYALLIAVTGYGQEQDRQSAIDAGFDHYLVKPVDTSKLAELLARCCAI